MLWLTTYICWWEFHQSCLNIGPIAYSVLQIIVFLILVGLLIYYFLDQNGYTYSTSKATATVPVNNTSAKLKEEDEKIELISKYKKLMDEGAITEEEYNKKKEEILNK